MRHDQINLSCMSDCNPICSIWKFADWKWSCKYTNWWLSAILKPVLKFLCQNGKPGCIFFTVHRTVYQTAYNYSPSIGLALDCIHPVYCFQPRQCWSYTHVWLLLSDRCMPGAGSLWGKSRCHYGTADGGGAGLDWPTGCFMPCDIMQKAIKLWRIGWGIGKCLVISCSIQS